MFWIGRFQEDPGAIHHLPVAIFHFSFETSGFINGKWQLANDEWKIPILLWLNARAR
jgi:hypothetical protein